MDAQRHFSPRATLPSDTRLENLGFGSTLAGFVAAALATVVSVAVPALDHGSSLAHWIDTCASLVTLAWPIANAAMAVLPG
jgi:hypothetical protein